MITKDNSIQIFPTLEYSGVKRKVNFATDYADYVAKWSRCPLKCSNEAGYTLGGCLK